jgi:hypothetical protein
MSRRIYLKGAPMIDEPLTPTATAEVKLLTAAELRECFEVALLRKVAIPSLEDCEKLLPFMPGGRPQAIVLSGPAIPAAADRARVDLLKALPAVETYWRGHVEATRPQGHLAAEHAVAWNNVVFNRLTALRAALEDARDLVAAGPDPFPENCDDAAAELRDVFTRGMEMSAPGRQFGFSGRGPGNRFVAAALLRLGYGERSADGLRKRYKRNQRASK